jgi:hypothetical protein
LELEEEEEEEELLDNMEEDECTEVMVVWEEQQNIRLDRRTLPEDSFFVLCFRLFRPWRLRCRTRQVAAAVIAYTARR